MDTTAIWKIQKTLKNGWSYALPESYSTELSASRKAEELRRTGERAIYEVIYVTLESPMNLSR